MRRRRMLRVSTAAELAGLGRLLRGRMCDLRSVALDDQSGRLHVPVLGHGAPATRPGRPSTGRRPVTDELVVGRVVELSVERGGTRRTFELDELVYDEERRCLAITSTGALRLLLTVEHLDLSLKMGDREPQSL